jgi:hypothetical protein
MEFLVRNYSCPQNPWLGGYRPQIPVLSVLCPQLNLLNPPRKKFLATPLLPCPVIGRILRNLNSKIIRQNRTIISICVKARQREKQSLYRPTAGLSVSRRFRLPDSRQLAHEGGVSALRTGRLYPQEIFLVLISVRGWIDPKTTVRPEGLCEWKTPVTLSWIEHATFRLVARCNQLRHRHIHRILIFLSIQGKKKLTFGRTPISSLGIKCDMLLRSNNVICRFAFR